MSLGDPSSWDVMLRWRWEAHSGEAVGARHEIEFDSSEGAEGLGSLSGSEELMEGEGVIAVLVYMSCAWLTMSHMSDIAIANCFR